MEQDFSSMQKTKMTSELLGGGLLPPMEKEIITFTKTNAQVSYDLNKMKLDVDSINKKLIISELPSADIKITPSVEIQSMDDSFFDRFDEKRAIPFVRGSGRLYTDMKSTVCSEQHISVAFEAIKKCSTSKILRKIF